MISAQVDLGWAGGEEAVILNVQQTGFYRVNYDLTNWGLLAQNLLDNHQQIHRSQGDLITNKHFEPVLVCCEFFLTVR